MIGAVAEDEVAEQGGGVPLEAEDGLQAAFGVGVAIGLFTKAAAASSCVCRADLWGEWESKYSWLLGSGSVDTEWTQLEPAPSFYLFEPFDGTGTDGYYDWSPINEIMPVNSVGIITARDSMTVDFDADVLWERVKTFATLAPEKARATYGLGKDARDWRVVTAQADVRASGPSKKKICTILYRPFDVRFTYYTGNSRGFYASPCRKVMLNMLAGENVALMTCRQSIGNGWKHLLATRLITDDSMVSNRTRERGYLFPIYLYPGVGSADTLLFSRWSKGKDGRTPNLDSGFVAQLADAVDLRFVSDGCGDLRKAFGPEDVVAYIYAVFHSPGYRERYEAQLKLDFPRVPLPGSVDLFRRLAEAGHHLLALHLLESLKLGKPITTYSGPKNPEVGRVGWSNGTIWLDAGKTSAREGHRATKPGTIGFQGVPAEVWDFQIGGYQVCHKWLKDRKDRTLSDEDVAHYQKIVVALNETIRIMAEIDEVIEVHSGWHDAFHTGSEADEARRGAG